MNFPINTKKLSSVQAYNTYGVSKTHASYLAHNFWSIPKAYRDLLSEYYLLRWEKKYFDSAFKEGTIVRNGIVYNVIYYRTDPVKIKKHEGDLLLSFRSVNKVYGIQPIVMVTLA